MALVAAAIACLLAVVGSRTAASGVQWFWFDDGACTVLSHGEFRESGGCTNMAGDAGSMRVTGCMSPEYSYTYYEARDCEGDGEHYTKQLADCTGPNSVGQYSAKFCSESTLSKTKFSDRKFSKDRFSKVHHGNVSIKKLYEDGEPSEPRVELAPLRLAASATAAAGAAALLTLASLLAFRRCGPGRPSVAAQVARSSMVNDLSEEGVQE